MDPFDTILGASSAAPAIREFGRRAAAVDAPVLITGETGTGKGLLARAIHAASPRARRPLVAVNCAGIAESLFESEFFGHTRGAFTGAQQSHRGLIEQADGGTLFLDEIGELSPPLQAKLLTALEDGEVRRVGGERSVHVSTRLIAATGVDLDDAVARGAFRRDLYHRLLVLAFNLPALRERDDDVLHFAEHFLAVYAERYRRPLTGFDRAATARLAAHVWPGNIRELAHVVEAAVLACDGGAIHTRHLPPLTTPRALPVAAQAAGAAPPRRYAFDGPPEEELRRIREALIACNGNRTRAARMLGMARNTLLGKLARGQ